MTQRDVRGSADFRALIHSGLRQSISRLDEHNRHVAEYHLGYVDQLGVPTAGNKGKLTRGTLALLSATAAGGAADSAMAAAVGVELVHQYSLLHDDIIDNDRSRRHQAAAWTVYGAEAAILAGDALAALALEVLLEEPNGGPAAQSLATATRRMIMGQAADVAFEKATVVPLDACIAMVANKTGALIECAASIGARLLGAAPELVAGLEQYGRHLGYTFQLIDDVIGLWGDPQQTGKPVGSDLHERKKSLPVVAALTRGGLPAQQLQQIYALDGQLSTVDVDRALAAIDEAGGREWALRTADQETTAALEILVDLNLPAAVHSEFRSLTDALCRRDH